MDRIPKASATVATESVGEWVPVSDIHPWPENPRRNDGEPVRKVAASIKRYGFGSPIVARRANGEIIAGHTRYKAALQLGLERVPVRYLDLPEAEAHMLALADNRTSEEAKWDEVLLAGILASVKSEDVADATAFDDVDLNRLLSEKGENDPIAEWAGTPECESEDQRAAFQILVSFATAEDRAKFGGLLGANLTPNTKALWYPAVAQDRVAHLTFAADDAEP